ncbi:hypothetical protein GWI33_011881 [Rhynchophorus ferrugineus]|uniref:Chitin-binding type-2 domain-containing protein n=1 Tax=Rhynchophorus ferrugineus TaxID=354439 RepID=A0A834MCV1_RHYFE|nr:hypothetical protein GWI33_011881 [Rhynchophorus ferrugineus]
MLSVFVRLLCLLGAVTATVDQTVCVYNPDPDYFECEQTGTFKNQNDLSCSTYYSCYPSLLGYHKSLKSCATGTYYNPTISACDYYYTCPCTESNKCLYVTDPDYFTCEGTGNFENLNDIECTTYFSCYHTSTGFHKTLKTCRPGTYFNPDKGLCDWYYARPCTTDTECNYNADPYYFNCTQSGSFANNNDLTCSTYYTCVSSGSGYIQTLESCASGSVFNPRISICDSYYTCPCTLVAENYNVQSVALINTCEEIPDATFLCSAEQGTGCFADPSDPYCEKYIYCYVSRSGVVYSAVKRSCPSGSYFNSSSTACSCSDYTCPCSKS